MAYKCLDCGNATRARFEQGKCPACDSFNVQRTDADAQQKIKYRKSKKGPFQIFLLILFWSLLAYGVWERYLQG